MFHAITDWVVANPEQCIILVLFLISEVLGNMSRFKSNSVFQLLMIVLRGMVAKTKFGVFANTDNDATPPPTATSTAPTLKEGADKTNSST